MAEKRPDYRRYLGNIFDSTIARKWKWCRYFGGVHFQMKIIKVQIRAEIVSVITSIVRRVINTIICETFEKYAQH